MAEREFAARGRRRLAPVILVATVLWSAVPGDLPASSGPTQRGEFVPAGTVAASVVTLCGLAVLLVVQPHEGRVTLYAGREMQSKLSELAVDGDTDGYELADLYEPIATSCGQIRAEHERVLGRGLKD